MMKKMMKDDERWHNVIILQTSTIEKSFYLDSVMSGIEFISILVIFLVLVPQTTSFRGRPPVFFGLTNNFASNRVSYDAQTTVLKNSRLQGVVSGLFFEQVALTGLISKRDQFSNHFVFKTVFEKEACGSLKCVSDDTTFARKRLVSPSTVYSGLFDKMQFEEVAQCDNITLLSNAIRGSDAWLAFNVSASMLKDFANVAVEQKLRRVVFAVPSVGDVDAVLFEEEVKILENAGVDFTILKYATPFQNCDEAKLPFRIVPGTSEIPKANAQNNFGKLASGDLFRVISELLDLKKSFGKVYGIGPGNVLDTEILVYMKAQGFSEHEQVGLLMGDFMERIEQDLKAKQVIN